MAEGADVTRSNDELVASGCKADKGGLDFVSCYVRKLPGAGLGGVLGGTGPSRGVLIDGGFRRVCGKLSMECTRYLVGILMI